MTMMKMKIQNKFATAFIFLATTAVSALMLARPVDSLQIAVIGTTGNIGRSVIQQLSKKGIPTRCLLRHDISNIEKEQIGIKDMGSPSSRFASSAEVAASLAALDHVEMVKGDVTDVESIKELIKGCDIVM
jgi:uncharacterized protein YbjT (DUF2867 family)